MKVFVDTSAIVGYMVPELEVVWIDETLHDTIVQAWVNSNSSKISLVDYASFAVMRQEEIRQAFAFDKHFRQQGFNVLN